MRLDRLAQAACAAELGLRGMREDQDGGLELDLAPGITGGVAISASEAPAGAAFTRLDPIVSVRHHETGELVSVLLGSAPGRPVQRSGGLVSVSLAELIPPEERSPAGWVLEAGADAGDLARRVADDVVFYGFPFMEGLRSAEALTREMERPRHRDIRRMDLAVLLMLTGRPDDARQLLREVRPVARHPPVFANNQYAKFLEGFSRHFGIDLDLASLPVRERADQPPFGRINIRQNGVVRNALINIGRADLAGRAAGLSESELRQISDRSTEIFNSMPERDLGRACGLAAAEFLDPATGTSAPDPGTPRRSRPRRRRWPPR